MARGLNEGTAHLPAEANTAMISRIRPPRGPGPIALPCDLTVARPSRRGKPMYAQIAACWLFQVHTVAGRIASWAQR